MHEFIINHLLWFKAFHVIFMVAWFAGIFYLPRLFVNHAETSSVEVAEHLKGMEKRLLYFITPFRNINGIARFNAYLCLWLHMVCCR